MGEQQQESSDGGAIPEEHCRESGDGRAVAVDILLWSCGCEAVAVELQPAVELWL